MDLLVRYGPAPDDTLDAAGRPHADFTGFFALPGLHANLERPGYAELLAAAGRAAGASASGVEGGEATGEGNADPFIALVRMIWAHATAPEDVGGLGSGHVLIGSYSGFGFCSAATPRGCGFQPEASAPHLVPKDYTPLYALVRAKKPSSGFVDLAVDYRGAAPGDLAVCPFIFGEEP